MSTKKNHLLEILRELRAVVVAFSGGIDSTVVAKAAFETLGDRAIAVTADSPSVARREIDDATRLAQESGIRHHLVRTDEFNDPSYIANDGARCYFCKTELYSQIESMLPSFQLHLGEEPVICSGANVDDQGDYRPGLKAASEHRVRHPLQEAGFTKADVRALAKEWNLPTWDKPASPCLSSRLAPGVELPRERTAPVQAFERQLRKLGLRECRARRHEGELLRIEVPIDALTLLIEPQVREELTAFCQSVGFQFVTLDLMGFRSGSLNSLVDLDLKKLYRQS